MTNLKEGQRIDVYEVVDAHDYGSPEEIIGFHAIGIERYNTRWQISVLVARNYKTLFLGFDFEHVKKCGYYLKVKSLKGGSNA